jgi:protein-S-isoprenylcysteine O-methyltransferase Ste14
MPAHPFHLVFLAGFVVYLSIRHKFMTYTRGRERVVNRCGTCERALLGIVTVGTMLLPMVAVFTNWLRFADYRLPLPVQIAGTVVMVLALWLFWRSHADLDLNWSMTLDVREGHQIVSHGVYSRIRHPMYAAIWLFALSQALLLDNWLAGWAGVATFGIMYLIRTPREEAMMCEHFGDEYRSYMRRTGRLFPRIRAATDG